MKLHLKKLVEFSGRRTLTSLIDAPRCGAISRELFSFRLAEKKTRRNSFSLAVFSIQWHLHLLVDLLWRCRVEWMCRTLWICDGRCWRRCVLLGSRVFFSKISIFGRGMSHRQMLHPVTPSRWGRWRPLHPFGHHHHLLDRPVDVMRAVIHNRRALRADTIIWCNHRLWNWFPRCGRASSLVSTCQRDHTCDSLLIIFNTWLSHVLRKICWISHNGKLPVTHRTSSDEIQAISIQGSSHRPIAYFAYLASRWIPWNELIEWTFSANCKFHSFAENT